MNFVIDKTTNLDIWYRENVQEKILTDLSEFQERDSGWSLNEILLLRDNINKYEPILWAAYADLPIKIKCKRAIVNVKNQDGYCFLSAIRCMQIEFKHYSEVVIYDDINFPMRSKNIPKFEELNSLRMFTLERIEKRNGVVPVTLSKTNNEIMINLLILYSEEGEEADDEEEEADDERIEMEMIQEMRALKYYHYVWIKICRGFGSHN